MADLIKINPASGDEFATLFASGSSSSEQIGKVAKGTMLKVVGVSKGFYQVAYIDPNAPSGIHGEGKCMSGSVVAVPYATMYKDKTKRRIESYVNNGTTCKILDDTNVRIFKIRAVTRDGPKDGWVETRYLMRDSIPPEEFGEISNSRPEGEEGCG